MRTYKFTDKNDILTFHSDPIVLWVIGAISALSFFLLGLGGRQINLLFVAIGLIAGIWAATRTRITVRVNRRTNLVSIRRQNLFKYKFDSFSVDDLARRFYVEMNEGDFSDRAGELRSELFLSVKMAEDIKIASESGESDYLREVAERLNEAIAKNQLTTP